MMKTTAIVCAIATAAMSFSGPIFAQERDYNGRDRAEQRHAARADHQWNGGQRTAPSWNYQTQVQPRYDQRTYSQPRYVYSQPYYGGYSAPRYAYNYGYASHPHYYAGGYYSGPRFVISNWGAYPGLYAPPYGYQWVQTDTGDFLLVAIATGLIANLLINGRF